MTLVRPIDGNALIEKIDKIDWYHVNEDGKLVSGAKNVSEAYFSAFDIYDAVEYMSTIDVVPVRHGHWNKITGSEHLRYVYGCSECLLRVYDYTYNYCPHCGATMDSRIGGDEE